MVKYKGTKTPHAIQQAYKSVNQKLTRLVAACFNELPSKIFCEALLLLAAADLREVKTPQILQLPLADVVSSINKEPSEKIRRNESSYRLLLIIDEW